MDSLLRIPSVTGIDLELKIAGPGGRSYAFIVDWHIRLLAALAWLFVGVLLLPTAWPVLPGDPNAATFAYTVVLPSAAIYFLYHPVIETLLHGQTPGKRVAGVRLVTLADGGVPSVGALLIRNVFRLIDSLPFLYAAGLVTTLITRHNVRIGDIAAGTVLVYDEPQSRKVFDELGGAAVERLGLAQAQLVRDLLERWPELGAAARCTLAGQLLAGLNVAVPDGEAALHDKLKELLT
jgi:uncharacterized RDD family membrane protein YckC